MESTVKKEYATLFGLSDGKKIINMIRGDNYSLEKVTDDRYVLTVEDGFPCIEIEFSKETAAGLLGGYYPPNNPGEASEMIENESLPATHLFVKIGDHKIDSFKNEKPSTMQISVYHGRCDSEMADHLEFEMAFGWNENDVWRDRLSETVIKLTLTRNEKTGAVAWWEDCELYLDKTGEVKVCENYEFYRDKTYHEVTGVLMNSDKCGT